tara:strand:- start:645 stop:1301 length:657 start_codon:yes stop_codon:yes gene_type:complete
MDKEKYIPMYDIFQKNIIIVVLIFSYLITLGVSWIIPTPTYPLFGPIIMFPFYISIYFLYMFVCKIFNKNYWIPNITKKIKINQKILDKHKINTKSKNFILDFIFYIYIIALIICLLIPIFDFFSASLIVFVIISYYKNNNLLFSLSIVISTIFIICYFTILFNIKTFSIYMFNIINHNREKTIIIGLIWICINALIVYKNLPEYRKHVKIEKDIQII